MSGSAFLTGYDHDVFVSYVHEEKLGEWTVRFRDELHKALNFILSLRPPAQLVNVWMDDELRKNLPLTTELEERVKRSALLVIVMSEYYLDSKWCGNEMSWFIATAQSRVAPARRVFVVQAKPTDREKWPASLADLPGYRFFQRHPEAQLELPLGFIGDKDDEVAFKAALYNLAGQIKRQMDELIAEAATAQAPAPAVSETDAGSVAIGPPAPTPARLVCLDLLGAPAPQADHAEQEIRRVLDARNVDIFAPNSLGPAPRDPAGAEKYLQKLVRAKSECDGLVLLRRDPTAHLADWLLDFMSEIRPVARRVRGNGSVPLQLLVDVDGSASTPPELLSLRFGAPQFERLLNEWVDRLPVAQAGAT